MKRVRFGIRVQLPLGAFPNAGIVVRRMSEDQERQLSGAVVILRRALEIAGMADIAARIVYEVSE